MPAGSASHFVSSLQRSYHLTRETRPASGPVSRGAVYRLEWSAGKTGGVHFFEVEVGLDLCWDLLRQRRALRNAGLDPSDAATRSEGTVEGYQQ